MNLLAKTLSVLGVASAAISAAVNYSPVTSEATESAQKLYNFLATNYNARTVAGIQTGEVNTATFQKLPDVDSFYVRIGKYPALVGFDFLFATGVNASDSWYKSYTQNIIAAAKDLWSQGGIPAFTWHWKDPSDQVDAFYATQSSAGAGNPFTTYDFTQGFTDPSCTEACTWNTSSTVYSQLKSDIDEIAAYFIELQSAGVAAVFRPLHEASGGWFWWGLRGGAAFKALYQLVYDEMKAQGVKNLVWVWNPEYAKDTDWNPGKSYYDIISLDIYEAYDYSTKFLSARTELETNFGKDIVLAISENGPIPDLSVMAENDSRWSWWMPWYQTWNGNFLNQTVDAVWKANVESPCTITLDKMPSWDSYALSNTPVASCDVGYKLGDIDTTRIVEEIFPGDTATNAWLRVKFNPPAGDTARGNVVIQSGSAIDLSTASTITLNVYNANKLSGIWFTVAFLGNESTDWGWAQPDGCWVNAGDSTQCTFDLSTTTKDNAVLSGSAYKTFMSNISKVYIEISGVGYSGTIFFDAVKTESSTINDFDDTTQKIAVEQGLNVEVAEIVGKGKTADIRSKAFAQSSLQMSIQGDMLFVALPKSGQAHISLLDVMGHQVKTLLRGQASAGEKSFSLRGIPSGNYIVRVMGEGFNASKALQVR